MEYFFKYLKTNIKYAAKSVFHKFKEYIPFLAALFIIQSVFFTLFISTATNSKNISTKLNEEFDYDVKISGLDYNQSILVEKELYIQSFMKKRSFENYRIEQASEAEGGDYRIYFVMREDTDLEKFIDYYINTPLGEPENVKLSTSPLYSYKMSAAESKDSPPLILVTIMCLISIAAITAIYSVRINNQKFMYGIYIAFGANLKKLISTSVFEMMLLALISFIPSAAFTYLFSVLIYLPFNISPIFNFSILIKVLISILIISIAGVYLPMKLVSRKTPVSLLSADDNSNLATSPARSRSLLKKSFPKYYENLSIWRFRKYYARLLLSSVIFTSIFICGFYIADMFSMSVDVPIREFTIQNSSEASDEEQLDDINFLYDRISGIEKVSNVRWNVDTPASLAISLALTEESARHNAGGIASTTLNIDCVDENMQTLYTSYAEKGYTSVTNSFKYSAFNEKSLAYIEENYNIEGDIYSVLNNDNTIIVSEEIFNTRRFKFKVGDKIILAKHISTLGGYDGDYFDTVGVLQYLVAEHTYEFHEFTVGAVIKNYGDSEGYFTIGLNESDYKMMTGNSIAPKTVNIYLDHDISIEKAENINSELTSIFYYMGSDYYLSRTYETVDRNITRQENQRVIAIFLSLLVVIMSPVVWFFSQTMFFSKRRKELYVLRAFGAQEESISRMFGYSGEIMSVFGFAVSTLMSLPASYLIYMTMNTWLPSLGFANTGIYYTFYLSPVAVILCALISAASGFLSSFIPYKLSLKEAKPRRSKRKSKQAQF